MSLNMTHVFTHNSNKLYIGNIRSQTHNMRAVVSVIDYAIPTHTHCFHKQIPAQDSEEFKLSRYFDDGADFIHNHLKSGNVLVHCYAGISRSTSIVIAYLIKYHGHTTNSALNLLKQTRPIVDPNDGFLKQLKNFESQGKQIKSYLLSNGFKNNNDKLQNKQAHRHVRSFLSPRMKTLY